MKRPLIAALLLALAPVTPPRAQDDLGVPSTDGLVVCTSAPACDAGASVLARGGNAVDAAVATAFALAVTHPSAGNIGGGGFMIVRTPSGRLTAFDYREKAPLKSTKTMYLDKDGNINRKLTETGYLAPGVPGAVRGLEAAHRKFGTLPWKDVVMPGVVLAEQGFELSSALATSLNTELKAMAPYPASVAAYGKPGGGVWAAGDRLILTDLGRTLRAIATDGPDAFYKGWIADRIAEDMAANGGLITKADLAAYKAKVRNPVRGRYRDFEIISMSPPSSGGVALIEMLNILEPLDLKSKGLLTAPALHAQIEAMRRAYLDRARYLGDPDFTDVPVSRLTSKPHAREVAATFKADKATSSTELGRDLLAATTTTFEPEETTHYSVIDRDGMAVATTTTLEGGFGSHVVVKGAGFLLNNEMGDFNRKPGETNPTGDIGTAAQPDRARQAHAQLDDAHYRGSKRQGRADHGIARRANDHEHGADDRRRRRRVRPQRPTGRGSGPHSPPMAAGLRGDRKDRCQRLGRRRVAGDGTRGSTPRAAGRRPLDLGVAGGHALRRQRQEKRGFQSLETRRRALTRDALRRAGR